MRYFKFFMIITLLPFFTSCNEDLTTTVPEENETVDFRAQNEEVKIFKHKLWFTATHDLNSPLIKAQPDIGQLFYSEGWIEGHATHIGKVDKEASRWKMKAVYFIPPTATDPPMLIQVVEGVITKFNGDAVSYRTTLYVDLQTNNLSGTTIHTGGKGRFKDAGGTMTLSGKSYGTPGDPNDPPKAVFTGEGTLTVPR